MAKDGIGRPSWKPPGKAETAIMMSEIAAGAGIEATLEAHGVFPCTWRKHRILVREGNGQGAEITRFITSITRANGQRVQAVQRRSVEDENGLTNSELQRLLRERSEYWGPQKATTVETNKDGTVKVIVAPDFPAAE